MELKVTLLVNGEVWNTGVINRKDQIYPDVMVWRDRLYSKMDESGNYSPATCDILPWYPEE